MNIRKKPSFFNKFVLLGAGIVTIAFILYFYIILNGVGYRDSARITPKAAITVLAVGAIPTTDLNLLVNTPSPTGDPQTVLEGIFLTAFVKITGTEGSGLRIHSDPGTTTDVLFLALESEVFIVIGGPQEADGITWWQLATPYDEGRLGWAAADYLDPLVE